MKLALPGVCLAMAPELGGVIAVGVYLGGTTVYMALFQRMLGLKRRIFALDTFCGIPSATAADRNDQGQAPYDAGEFTDTSLDLVKNTYARAGVAHDITAVPGLVQATLPAVLDEVGGVSFMFSDTDQYAGTLASLYAVLPHLDREGMVIVDDYGCGGVATATSEVLAEYPAYGGGSVSLNFFLVHAKTGTGA